MPKKSVARAYEKKYGKRPIAGYGKEKAKWDKDLVLFTDGWEAHKKKVRLPTKLIANKKDEDSWPPPTTENINTNILLKSHPAILDFRMERKLPFSKLATTISPK